MFSDYFSACKFTTYLLYNHTIEPLFLQNFRNSFAIRPFRSRLFIFSQSIKLFINRLHLIYKHNRSLQTEASVYLYEK